MTCDPEVLKQVPLFALLDDDEAALLAGKVELKTFAARQRIYKMGEPGGRAYVVVSGKARVTTVDEDQQEVVLDEPTAGDFFGFASMLQQTPHETGAMSLEETVCVEVDRTTFELIQETARRDGHALGARPPVSCRASTGSRPFDAKPQ